MRGLVMENQHWYDVEGFRLRVHGLWVGLGVQKIGRVQGEFLLV